MPNDSAAANRSESSSPRGAMDATAAGLEPEAPGRSERILFLTYLFALGASLGFSLRSWIPGTEQQRHRRVAAAIRLAPMLVVGLIPFAVLLFIIENRTRHHVFSDILPFFVGCWAIFSLWMILAKGMPGVLGKNATGITWFLLGLLNLIAALGTLLLLAMI